MRKLQKVSKKMRKCPISRENMQKCPNCWVSVSKCLISWKIKRNPAKSRGSVLKTEKVLKKGSMSWEGMKSVQ